MVELLSAWHTCMVHQTLYKLALSCNFILDLSKLWHLQTLIINRSSEFLLYHRFNVN